MRSILRRGKELLTLEDPLDAELWTSGVLGTTYKPSLPIGVQGRFGEAVWDGVVTRAEAQGGATSLAVLRALGAVASDPVASRATEAADRIAAGGTIEPVWGAAIGSAEFLDAWRLADPYGDQTMYHASFRYPGRPAHALTALYDENIGAIVKDAGVGTVAGGARARAAEEPGAEVEDIDAGALAGVVRAFGGHLW